MEITIAALYFAAEFLFRKYINTYF